MVVLDEDTLEFKRQMIHLLNGIPITAAVYFLKPVFGVWVLAPLILALLVLYFVPRAIPGLEISNHLLYHFERRKDIANFPYKGAIMYGLGIILPILLLEVHYSCAIILILSVGDAFSNLVGRKYGRHMIGRRSLEGSVGFFVTSTAAAALMVNPIHAIWLSFAGTLIELFLPWDDNLTIPWGLSIIALAAGVSPLAL